MYYTFIGIKPNQYGRNRGWCRSSRWRPKEAHRMGQEMDCRVNCCSWRLWLRVWSVFRSGLWCLWVQMFRSSLEPKVVSGCKLSGGCAVALVRCWQEPLYLLCWQDWVFYITLGDGVLAIVYWSLCIDGVLSVALNLCVSATVDPLWFVPQQQLFKPGTH